VRLHVTTRDDWTGERGLELSWDSSLLEWSLTLGFGGRPRGSFLGPWKLARRRTEARVWLEKETT
jgi:hypothetical protein